MSNNPVRTMLHSAALVETLVSDKKLALLNDIDKLRSHGISQYVNLPQLIVCGDQSSGKSSVLEAISGISFPTKDNLCTRFATEVILRHTSDVKIFVAIVPGPERSEAEQAKLHAFRRDQFDLENFAQLIEDAKTCMGVTSSPSAFSTDVLRLEISGPNQPHLTIVDLPGLIHSENKVQTSADIQIVQSMVYEYMINRRSIILAVISAKNDYANQVVLKLARQVDPHGKRTMGVITKPDTLSVGSESEEAFVNLARNMDIAFHFGWHVLRNRSYEDRELSKEARDNAECQFLSQGAWKDLARDTVGIHTLRGKLSEILLNQIRAELPALIEDIEKRMEDRRGMLARLGPNRDGFDQQRSFLLNISQEFQAISKAALDGSYGHRFFGESRSADGYTKRLRAVIQNLNADFAESVRLRGHQRRIIEHTVTSSDPREEMGTISRGAFINEIRELLRITRGRELPGMFNPLIVGDLFNEQSKPWEPLARQHLRRVWQAVKYFLEMLIAHLADEPTSEALLFQVLDPLMDQQLKNMNAKLDEILGPHQNGHPITYNHYFTETIQKVKEKRREAEIARRLKKFLGQNENENAPVSVKNAKMPNLLSALASNTEADMDRYACSEILDCMEAYYKVAMKSLIDNVAIHAVERCLVAGISDLLSPSYVLQMERELVHGIAAEPLQNQSLRERTKKEMRILQAGLQVCRVHANRKSLTSREVLTSGSISFPHRTACSNLEDADNMSETEGSAENISTGLPETITISSNLDLVTFSNGIEDPELSPTPDLMSAPFQSSFDSWLTPTTSATAVACSPIPSKPKKQKKLPKA